MLFVFLDFNIELDASIIGLIPDFAGYILMFFGLCEIKTFSGSFASIRPYVIGMAVYSAAFYVIDLLGVSASIEFLPLLAAQIVSTVLSLYISYSIIMGIRDVERTREQELGSVRLYRAWQIMAALSVLTYFMYLYPELLFICVVIGFIVGVYYLVVFYKTKSMFYEQNPAPR